MDLNNKVLPDSAKPKLGDANTGNDQVQEQRHRPFDGQPSVSLTVPAGAVEMILAKLDVATYQGLQESSHGMYVQQLIGEQYQKAMQSQQAERKTA